MLLFWLWRPKLFDSEEYFDEIYYVWLFSTLGLLLSFLLGLFMTLRNLVQKIWGKHSGSCWWAGWAWVQVYSFG
ncbi:hypothetical protein [Hymenobacter algoricola]|uniref:Uncharacterized protein n=1 Tax=Hymenobacter algoricola TaxID=486267 RepID=A0ABP7N8E2_9BACT